MTEAERNSIALFRYGILAPFIQRQVVIANKWSYFNKVAEKQYEYIDYYYNNDLSLSEIANILATTRANVHDTLTKARNNLKPFLFIE